MKIYEIMFQALVEGQWYDHCSSVVAASPEEAIELLETNMGIDKDNILSIQETAEIPDPASFTPRTLH